MDYKEKGKLVTKMASVLEEYGLESNIPHGHDYWDMKRRLRLIGNSSIPIQNDVPIEQAGVILEQAKPADTTVLTENTTVIPSDSPFGF